MLPSRFGHDVDLAVGHGGEEFRGGAEFDLFAGRHADLPKLLIGQLPFATSRSLIRRGFPGVVS